MDESQQRISDFIECENAFGVMARFEKEGILTKQDVRDAMKMDRDG